MLASVSGKIGCNRVDGGLVNFGVVSVVAKAAAVPELAGAMNGAAASISSICSLIMSAVGSTRMPPSPISFKGMQ